MKLKQQRTKREQQQRQNFISVDNTISINSYGDFFHIGDEVKHEGAGDEIAVIEQFIVLTDDEIKVKTSRGICTLDFLEVIKTNEYE